MKNRTAKPPGMRFQPRDAHILRRIFEHDGLLTRRQIKQLFWPQASDQAMERRLKLLSQAGYLNLPSASERRSQPIPEPIVFLGWRGAIYLAAQLNIDVEIPEQPNENQLRKLERSLRAKGFRWQRTPRWSQLAHDIAVNDFRLNLEQAVNLQPSISLEEWIPEGEFLTNMDKVSFTYQGKKRNRGVRPDGFFVLVDHQRQIRSSPARARFLLELDNSTHPLTRFGRDKALPGLAYIRSSTYRQRFGFNSGRWLVVCKSVRRMVNLKEQTERVLAKQAANFLFTTFGKTAPNLVLSRSIWLKGGSDKPVPLIGNDGDGR